MKVTKRKIWTDEENEYLKNNIQNLENQELAINLNATHGQVRAQIARLKLKRQYIDPINISLFTNITLPEIAYFLGYFWADGSVKCGNGYLSMLRIQKEDALEIRDLVHSFGRVLEYELKRRQKSHKDQISFNLQSRGLFNFLIENDFYEKSIKSPNKILSKIPKHLQHYFWRGFFDGDGCLYIKEHGRSITHTGAFGQDWSCLETLLKSLKIEYKLNRVINKSFHKTSNIKISNNLNILPFLNFIYKNRDEDKIGLSRKYNKFKTLIELIKANIDNKICIDYDRRQSINKIIVSLRTNARGTFPTKGFSNITDAVNYKKKLIKEYKTPEYLIRELINYDSYENQVDAFIKRHNLNQLIATE